MPIRIVSVGKKHEFWLVDGIERYQKRLKRPFDIEWVFLSHSSQTELVARQNESESILKQLNANDFVILLDERGANITSKELSGILRQNFDISKRVVVIIGGAYGVNEMLYNRADFVWSLSKLVFPHQLVRLILIEQLYRAQEIGLGHPYHHE